MLDIVVLQIHFYICFIHSVTRKIKTTLLEQMFILLLGQSWWVTELKSWEPLVYRIQDRLYMLKGIVLPKMRIVIMYLPFCHFKPV